jgi:hypothetical protein
VSLAAWEEKPWSAGEPLAGQRKSSEERAA